VLAGDDAFVGLRKRRLQHRTLLLLEEQTKRFAERRQAQAKDADAAAQEQLESAQKRLNQQVEAVRARTDLDEQSKAITLGKLQEVANRRLAVEEANIKDQKRRKDQESKAEMERQIRQIQNRVRSLAIAIPPLPALALGLFVFGARLRRENQGANPNRIAH